MSLYPVRPQKLFNVAGPCDPALHYMLPAIERLPETRQLISNGQYFVIHSARQSGKTTLLQALMREINAGEQFYALYCSLEALQGWDDLDKAGNLVSDLLGQALRWSGVPEMAAIQLPAAGGSHMATKVALQEISQALPRPLVLFFDETDCLSGQVLVTFLRQIRDGFVNRSSAPFPWSLALVGMRDIRDFKAQVRPDRDTLSSASPFNIVSDVLTLGNFTAEQITALYRQHTEATGQIFDPDACERSWYWTQGQPWLVNALVRQVVEKDLAGDYAKPVTAERIDAAAETLMKRRDTHIDSLLERLKEPRVKRIIEPVLFGGEYSVDPLHDDTKFCLDLGMVVWDKKEGLRPANPIYRDVMVRTLNFGTQVSH